ncbi:ATP-binding cassette domain-containing protein [Pseudaminobacter sp. 19-2017]|uniref:ATP-binding cassette domain-containing protein n=1 Tax=Pseudaminobacter soli (ex Zhang et al. 2022) TaxID=2831468 RepID=A0A942E3U1_9HYPH|nr:oligopeptide/dipeptide ABC transporter ATP-binding protein [Pseudaminobacter soli]MBS3652492.1 ATP-binding cassette domain-containing protein [Pseudaminobacter soli]
MSGQSTVLEVQDVTRTYQVSHGLFGGNKELRALRGVTLSLKKGEVLGIVGESGCGKSTLARLLLALDKPTTGDILLDGRPVSKTKTGIISRKVQPIFQDPYSSLNPRKTIGSIITLPLRVHKIGNAASQREAMLEIMDRVGLSTRFINSYPNQLSGGQRQRVAIARALIMKPEVVICDEPTSALDVSVQSQILNMLQDLQVKYNLTYVFISHNLAVVEHIATRVAVMYFGRIVEQAETEAFFRNPRHPYSQALLGSVLTPDPELGVPDPDLGTVFPDPLNPPVGCAFHPRCPKRVTVCDQRHPEPTGDRDDFVECHLFGPANS